MNTLPQIDQEIILVDPHNGELGPYVVVDLTDTEFILRMDADSNDASTHPGDVGVDWEYVYIDPRYAEWRIA